MRVILWTTVCWLVLTPLVEAADWPAWRHDAQRSAATDEQLAAQLHLHWTRQLTALRPAWPEDSRLQFDACYEPVVAGQTMVYGSSANDSLTAVDLNSGKIRWRFFTDGPVRFAPLLYRGRVYAGADDGGLYCLNLSDGKLLWKFVAAPTQRRVIGNDRLISVWPVRGGPVLSDGRIQFTVGVWPFEGTFLYSLDPETGQAAAGAAPSQDAPLPEYDVTTLNDLTPQGYLTVAGSRLYIPQGRAAVTALDTKTHKFQLYKYRTSSVTNYHVCGRGRWLFHGAVTYDTQTGKQLDLSLRTPVLADKVMYAAHGNLLAAYDLTQPKMLEKTDRKGKKTQTETLERLWSLPAERITAIPEKNRKQWLAAHPLSIDVKAGTRLYGHQGQTVFAVDLPQGQQPPTVSWTHKIDGQVTSVLAANGRLVVVTREGRIVCFGAAQRTPQLLREPHTDLVTDDNDWRAAAQQILKQEKPGAAFCLALGIGSGNLILEILKQSPLRVIAIDADAGRVERFRQRCDRMGLQGQRLVALVGDPYQLELPPYLASLVVSETALPAAVADDPRRLAYFYARLRPYGGSAWLPQDANQHQRLSQGVAAAKLAKAQITRQQGLTRLVRQGALPGAADWTHEYGDASNTLMSLDQLVKAPLGVLWFGGPASDGSLFYNRHFWGPSMAVVNGRMFIQGPGKMTAVDVYTGRILWQIPLKDEQDYRPGRRGNDFEKHLSGFHFLAVEDAIYLVQGASCVKLDPTSGQRVAEFPVGQPDAEWGRIRVKGDLLIGTVFQQIDADPKKVPPPRRLLVGQKVPLQIVALNRQTGEKVWSHEATSSFPVLSVGRDRIYCFDGALESFYKDWKRRGVIPKASDRRKLVAIDLASGKVEWEKDAYIIGTWLAYSGGKDVVLLSNKENIVAFDGRTGDELWKQYSEGVGFRGHPESLWDRIIVWNDRVLDQRGPGLAWNLRTGERMQRKHPITQTPVEWEFTKEGHHCNYAIANPHLMTFRAESAGFCDIESGNTARLKGFRSGCRNSLIPANGVLNAPNFAHGCVCGYSLFTSLALVHQPDSEMWSYSALALKPDAGPVQRLGVNLGAPGDRMSPDGTLWLDYPNVGGTSPKAAISLQGNAPSYFRRHSSLVQGRGLNWVAGSGVVGAASIKIDLGKRQQGSGSYTVRLHFCEPDDVAANQRVFSVKVQDQLAVENLDVVKDSGGPHRSLIREVANVQVESSLKIDLIPHKGRPVLSGIEVVARPE